MFNPRATLVRRISLGCPEVALIAEAATVLREGGLVAFPTETVYGLGANALNAAAVESIFSAKGRPANNPVIVHVADADSAKRLVATWPATAAQLAAAFWPGSLTLVLPKRPEVPDVVTAGGATVAVRVPAHNVALALLKAVQLPIAAPSANRSTCVSPTTADHVRRGLDGRIDMILDAGPTSGGLESTVVDLTANPPRLLRPGLVSVAQLQAVIGPIVMGASISSAGEALRSPGMQPRHYSPRAKVICVVRGSDSTVRELLAQVNRVGWLRFDASRHSSHPDCLAEGERIDPLRAGMQDRGCKVIEMPSDPVGYAVGLYAALHEMDDAEVDVIVIDLPPDGAEWLAIQDRLRRAAS